MRKAGFWIMFTGIIEEIGSVLRIANYVDSAQMTIGGQQIFTDLKLGDSVAVNGVCLTVAALTSTNFTADIMPETISRSSLGSLSVGSRVNLERALPANGRLGGHIVSGHIDGMGTVVSIQRDANAVWYSISAPTHILKYVVEKGSIAIDGISLTVARVSEAEFAVSLVAHTVAKTTLADKNVGDRVNLENDIIGKYVEKLLLLTNEKPPETGGLTREKLLELGY